MAIPQFQRALRRTRRKARLSGRSVSAAEMSGLARGYAESASQRLQTGKLLELKERGLEQTREMQTERIGAERERQAERLALQKGLQAEQLRQQESQFGREFGRKGEEFERMYGEEGIYPEKWEAERGVTERGQDIQRFGIQVQEGTQRYGIETRAATERRGQDIRASTERHRTDVENETDWYDFIPDVGVNVPCIIITACTSSNSYEVNIAREYRDKILDRITLGGYYALCKILVPLIHRSNKFKGLIKRFLVDRMIDYSEIALKHKNKMQYKRSWIISKAFLRFCKLIGKCVNYKYWIAIHN